MSFTKFGLESGNELFQSEAIFRRFDFNADDREPYLDETVFAKHRETAEALWDASKHKVILLIGEHNVKQFVQEELRMLNAIEIKGSDIKMFGREACVWLVLSEGGEDIEKIVIPSYHTQYFFYSPDITRGKMMDDMWNLAGVLGGLSNVNASFFEYCCRRNTKEPAWSTSFSVRDIVIGMLAQEKATGELITKIPDPLTDYIERKGISIRDDESRARQIHKFWASTRRATLENKTPEEKEATAAKLRATFAKKTPEQKAERAGKIRATIQKNKSEENAETAAKREAKKDEKLAKQRATIGKRTPEEKEAIAAKRRATLANKTPEENEAIAAKREAKMDKIAAKKRATLAKKKETAETAARKA